MVEVDRLGQAQAIAPADAAFRPTDPQIAFHLARFIEQVRSIPADPVVLRQDWLRAYDFTTQRGARMPSDYAPSNDPFTRVGKVQIAVDVSRVIRAADQSNAILSPSDHPSDQFDAITDTIRLLVCSDISPVQLASLYQEKPQKTAVLGTVWDAVKERPGDLRESKLLIKTLT